MPTPTHALITATAIAFIALGSRPTANAAEPAENTSSRGDSESGEASDAFERAFALGLYYSRRDGSDYGTNGVGGKVRWEGGLVGIDIYAEALFSARGAYDRVDVPFGFSLYVPFHLFGGLRIRALAGICGMFSFASLRGGPSADDVRVGLHAGAGLEYAINSRWSVFADVTWQGYFGHARNLKDWAAAIGNDLDRDDSIQMGVGLQLHL